MGDGERFAKALAAAVPGGREGIGTYKEKTLHAVLKRYFEPDAAKHEIRVDGFVADIVNDNGIIEIQTRSFNALRKKLGVFLQKGPVTVVYPIAETKWLSWLDEKTGEALSRRKSPKTGRPWEAFFEFYRIKPLLKNPNLTLCVVMLDMEEYRLLNGWSADRKRGSTRFERIPSSLKDEILIRRPVDYQKLLPPGLPERFTSADFKEKGRVSRSVAQTALNILYFMGVVEREGKKGNAFLYRKV